MERPTTINFPPSRKQLLKIEAARNGTTMERLIVEAFDVFVELPPEAKAEILASPEPNGGPSDASLRQGIARRWWKDNASRESGIGERVVPSSSTPKTEKTPQKAAPGAGSDIKPEPSEVLWVKGLLAVLRGKNELAKNAILTNILAFTDYSKSVPEVAGAGADIDAIQARLAAIDKRVVDDRKNADVGGGSAKPKADPHSKGGTGKK